MAKFTSNINKLQRVHNTLAKVIINNKFCSSAEALHQLHWLPIKQRINFKISSITYCILQSGSPHIIFVTHHSLSNTITNTLLRCTSSPTRSSHISTAIGHKAFSFALCSTINMQFYSTPHQACLLYTSDAADE